MVLEIINYLELLSDIPFRAVMAIVKLEMPFSCYLLSHMDVASSQVSGWTCGVYRKAPFSQRRYLDLTSMHIVLATGPI